jgi:hypothetical protein
MLLGWDIHTVQTVSYRGGGESHEETSWATRVGIRRRGQGHYMAPKSHRQSQCVYAAAYVMP